MYEFINLIKALAACLVVNSHFDGIWPISAFATGGSIGNCLFFVSTGFLLANIKQKFVPWYFKKLVRIYPGVLIMETLVLLLLRSTTDLFGQYGILANYFIFAGYWFLQALIFLYIPYYIVMSTKLKQHLLFVGLVLTVVYFAFYTFFVDRTVWSIEATRFKWIFYFAIMLIGGGYALKIKQQKKILNKCIAGVISLVMFVAFYGFKFLLHKYPQIMPLQFIEHIILVVLIYALLALLLHYEKIIKYWDEKKWWKPIKFLGGLTLEIYLVMDFIINRIEMLSFPMSLFLACCLIPLCAWMLKRTSEWISDILIRVGKSCWGGKCYDSN